MKKPTITSEDLDNSVQRISMRLSIASSDISSIQHLFKAARNKKCNYNKMIAWLGKANEMLCELDASLWHAYNIDIKKTNDSKRDQ